MQEEVDVDVVEVEGDDILGEAAGGRGMGYLGR